MDSDVQNNDIYENCHYCGKQFDDVKDIYVSIDEDNYICKKCSNKLNIEVVKCIE